MEALGITGLKVTGQAAPFYELSRGVFYGTDRIGILPHAFEASIDAGRVQLRVNHGRTAIAMQCDGSLSIWPTATALRFSAIIEDVQWERIVATAARNRVLNGVSVGLRPDFGALEDVPGALNAFWAHRAELVEISLVIGDVPKFDHTWVLVQS